MGWDGIGCFHEILDLSSSGEESGILHTKAISWKSDRKGAAQLAGFSFQ